MRLRLPVAVVAALVVAEAAVLLMRPRDLVEPLDVAPRAYFSAQQVERAEDFRSGQLWLFGAQTALERSEEHTSELQSRQYLVCRLLLEKKKNTMYSIV